MKKIGFTIIVSFLIILVGCRKDEGLNDADHKSKFIKTYGTLSEGVDIAQTGDGGYIIFGTIQGASSTDLYLKKIDAFGNDQWSKSYGGGYAGTSEEASKILVLNDGSYVLIGTTSDSVIDAKAQIALPIRSSYLLHVDYLGHYIKSGIYNSGDVSPYVENEKGFGIAQIPENAGTNVDGGFLLVSERSVVEEGTTNESKTGVLRIIDQYELTIIDEKSTDDTLLGVTGSNIGYRDISISADNIAYATGFTDQGGDDGNAGGNSVLYSAFSQNADGFTQFPGYGGLENDLGRKVLISSAGEILIAGYSTINGQRQFYVLNFAKPADVVLTPVPQWRYNTETLGESEANDIVEVSDGYVIVGFNEVENDRQMFITKIDKSGTSTPIWQQEYGFESFDEANAVIATDDNGIAVLGTSSDERGNRIMTLLKLDANGNLR